MRWAATCRAGRGRRWRGCWRPPRCIRRWPSTARCLSAAWRCAGRIRELREASAPAFGAMIGLPVFLDFARLEGPARACLLSRTYFFVATWSLVRMGGRVRAAGLAGVVRRGPAPAHAARVSKAGNRVDSLRAGVHVGRPGAGDPAPGELQPPATDAEFSSAVCHFFPAVGRVDRRVRTRDARLAVGGAVCSAGAGNGAGAGEHIPGQPHVEWPGARGGNTWILAFLWIPVKIRPKTPSSPWIRITWRGREKMRTDSGQWRSAACWRTI